MQEEIFALLEKLGIARENGSHKIGKFDMDISREGRSIAFWLVGKRKDKQAWVFNKGRSLIVVVVGEQTMVSDLFGLKIIKYIGDYLKYPHTELHWIGWDMSESMKKGTLTYAQVDLSGTHYLFFQKEYVDQGFLGFDSIYNNLSSADLSKKIREAEDSLGDVIIKKIDFDAEVDELITKSGLEKFLGELRLLAEEEKPISM